MVRSRVEEETAAAACAGWRFGVVGDAGVQAVVELGTGPEEGEGSYRFSAWRDSTAVCLDSGSGAVDITPEARRVGPLSVERLASEEGAWRIAHSGDGFEAEITWRPLSDPREWSPSFVGGPHLEQAGRAEGVLRFGGAELALSGLGQRTEWTGEGLIELAAHGWVARVFHDEDFHSQHGIVTVGGRDRMFGHLRRDGDEASLASAEVAISHAYSGGPALLASIGLETPGGPVASYEVLRGGTVFTAVEAIPGGFVTRHLSFPTFRADDGREAVGEIEHWFSDPGLVRPQLAMTAVEGQL